MGGVGVEGDDGDEGRRGAARRESEARLFWGVLSSSMPGAFLEMKQVLL